MIRAFVLAGRLDIQMLEVDLPKVVRLALQADLTTLDERLKEE